MISRVFRGHSAYGLVKYLYGEGRRNEHTDAHMIASWDGNPASMEPELVAGRHNVGPLVHLLEEPVRICERAPAEWVYHLVLRNAPEDRRLSDDEWAEVCAAAMDRTGIAPDGDLAACRWVAVRHAEDHVHLVATLAREDGRAPHLWHDYRQLNQVRHEFEDRYGLRSTAARDDSTAAPRPGVKEQVTAEAKGRRVSPRVMLREKVKAAAAGSAGFDDFRSVLAREGVTVWPRMSERNPDQITGYSVSLDDWTNAAGEPVRFGGGKLAPDLSWPQLNARWAPTTTDKPAAGRPDSGRHAAPDEPTSTSSAGPRLPLTGDEAEYVWREAERIVRQAAEQITVDAATNPDAASDAAWAAADALSAAAAGLEGDAGGPITDAATAFDRAGRETYRRIPTRTDTGTALRSAGRMITLLAPGTNHAGARVAAVTTALAALVAAVADLRQSQQRLHQAEAALASAEQLRRVAPIAQPAVQAPRRPPNAADLAAMSFARPLGRVRPYKAPTTTKKPSGPRTDSQKRRDPGQGQGRGPTSH